jgi:hypothetical protein
VGKAIWPTRARTALPEKRRGPITQPAGREARGKAR